MAASITDLLDRVSSSATGRPVVAALAAPGHSIGGVTFNINDATNWDTGSAKKFSIYATQTIGGVVVKDPTTQTDWKGTLAGTVISNGVLTGGTDRDYSAGAIVELTPTSRYARDLYDWAIAQHNQDGSHAAITATSLVASGSVTGASLIATGDIQHRNTSLETIRSEMEFDYVASGCVWSGDAYGSTRLASMTAGVVYIGGRRATVSVVTGRTFTASRDTYIDVDNTGVITYTEVTNNAASPALAANNVRIGIIVTGAGSIAAVGSVNQGQYDRVLPIASSIAYCFCDSLGNIICPRDPNRKVVGYRQQVTVQGSITTVVDITGLSTLVKIPTGRNIKVTANIAPSNGTVNTNTQMIIDYSGTTIGSGSTMHPNINANNVNTTVAYYTATSVNPTIKIRAQTQLGGTSATNTSAASPAYVLIELE